MPGHHVVERLVFPTFFDGFWGSFALIASVLACVSGLHRAPSQAPHFALGRTVISLVSNGPLDHLKITKMHVLTRFPGSSGPPGPLQNHKNTRISNEFQWFSENAVFTAA